MVILSSKSTRTLRFENLCQRGTDLAVLRQHVSHVADLAASVMHHLDSKRRRFDARRIHGEGEDWQDWQEILKSPLRNDFIYSKYSGTLTFEIFC